MGDYKSEKRERITHNAVCDKCKKDCTVPFKPTGNKPVLCSDCFNNQSNDDSNKRGRHSDRGNRHGSDRGERKMFEATCDKCKQKCQVPFQPTSGKPIFCETCFKIKQSLDANQNETQEKFQEQIEAINEKLDKITASIEILAEGRMVREVKVVTPKSKEDKDGPILTSDKNPILKSS